MKDRQYLINKQVAAKFDTSLEQDIFIFQEVYDPFISKEKLIYEPQGNVLILS